ncbi:hypothetical protein BDQ12DRAFT_400823 [Crucibulum laeve]|uniref:Extracellular membrane protein CFEM domain-containing protein n=1 Tax=Crucibulum laeve TaxID=68775 RepID=A0A5C3LLQ9_9AGAR|nr:hypothetical protein BDQ12DRAFT_400823 [Crucibulum laeve]
MVGYTTFFTALTASLLVVSPQMVAASPSPLNALLAVRQSTGISPSDVPDKCKSQCSAIIDTTQNCTTASCLCTDKVVNGMATCFNCAIAIGDSGGVSVDSAQTIVDQFVANCNTLGSSVKSVSVKDAKSNGGERIIVASASGLLLALIGGVALML